MCCAVARSFLGGGLRGAVRRFRSLRIARAKFGPGVPSSLMMPLDRMLSMRWPPFGL